MSFNRAVCASRIASRILRADRSFIFVGGTTELSNHQRGFHTSEVRAIKEIIHRDEKGVTVIEAVFGDSPHKDALIQQGTTAATTDARCCPLCRLGIQNVKHTDVLVISQFMDRKGDILPREVTGLCFRQHKLVSLRLYEAQRCGYITSEKHKPNERWQELNNYFGHTKTKVDFGKPKINIIDFLRKPLNKKVWE